MADNLVKQESNKFPARDEQGRLLPGHTANPNGRPKREHSITDAIREIMDEKPDLRKALGTKLIKMAIEEGDLGAMKLIINYLEGMPVQPTDITSNGEEVRIMFHAALKQRGVDADGV